MIDTTLKTYGEDVFSPKAMKKYLPEDVAVREFRAVMPFYIKGLPGSAAIKVKLCSASKIDEVKEILNFD